MWMARSASMAWAFSSVNQSRNLYNSFLQKFKEIKYPPGRDYPHQHHTGAFVTGRLRWLRIESDGALFNVHCEVVLVPSTYVRQGLAKRLLQLRSLASTRSFERLQVTVPAMQRALDRVLRARRFDVVNLEFSFLGDCDLRQAPPGERLPALVVDSHNIDYDLARQYARAGNSLTRRLYAEANWRKLRREELGTYRDADGVYLCSAADERRLLHQVPGVRTAVIPNAADVEYYQPRPTDPPSDGRTVVYFGLLSYVPNVDGVTHFVRDI